MKVVNCFHEIVLLPVAKFQDLSVIAAPRNRRVSDSNQKQSELYFGALSFC